MPNLSTKRGVCQSFVTPSLLASLVSPLSHPCRGKGETRVAYGEGTGNKVSLNAFSPRLFKELASPVMIDGRRVSRVQRIMLCQFQIYFQLVKFL